MLKLKGVEGEVGNYYTFIDLVIKGFNVLAMPG